MKILSIITLLLSTFAVPVMAHAAAYPYGVGGTGTTTPAIGQLVWWGATNLKGVATTTATCAGTLTCSSFIVIGSTPITLTGSAGGGSFPFTPTAYGVSTSTTVGFLNGLMATASSTFTATTTVSGPLIAKGSISGVQIFGDDANTGLTMTGGTAQSVLDSVRLPYVYIGNGPTGFNGVNISAPEGLGLLLTDNPADIVYVNSGPLSLSRYVSFPDVTGTAGVGAATTSGSLAYWGGNAGLYAAATTSVTCSGSVSCSTFNVLGSSPITISGSGGSGAWPWTIETNFATSTNSTTTPTWYKTGVYASSTSQFENINTSNGATSTNLGILSLAGAGNNILIVRNAGNVDKITLPLTTANGGTGTTTWQTNSIPYYNGTRLTEVNSALNFNGSLLTATNASTTNFSATTICFTGDTCRTTWPTGGSGAWPWTVATNFATSTNATTTGSWFQQGLYASSTSEFVNTNVWGNLTLKATTSALLATGPAGVVIATTSVGVNYLTGVLPIANGGTNASSIASHMLTAFDGTRYVATSTPTVGAIYATSTATSTFAGQLLIGTASAGITPQNKLAVVNSANDYHGIWVQNTSNGASASTDIVAGNDNANVDPSAYVDLGANSTGNTNASFTLFGKGDAYLFSNSGLGNLVIANGSTTKSTIFGCGGFLIVNECMRLTAGGRVGIGTTTPQWPLTIASSTRPQIALTGTGANIWTIREAGGYLYFATSSPTTYATTTAPAMQMGGGAPSLSVGSSTPTFPAGNGLVTLGNTSSGTSTVSMGKIQFDGYNSAGTRVCMYIVGTTLTVSSGSCTQ